MTPDTEIFRTPEEQFEGLPDFPWEPKYSDWDGIRLARIDEGEGSPVVLFHGEPTWSYLYRKMIPPLLDAGHRCIAPDYAGFGRSDKPPDFGWYSYDRHATAMAALLNELDVRDATFVVQDWGGPIGMRVAAEHPEMFARLVVMDTGFFTGRQPMTDAWKKFRDFVAAAPRTCRSRCWSAAPATRAVATRCCAATAPPIPDPASKAGARAFPLMLPTDARRARRGRGRPADDGDDLGLEPPGARALGRTRPDHPGLDRPQARRADRLARPRGRSRDASHFLQEDQGELLGIRIADWLAG